MSESKHTPDLLAVCKAFVAQMEHALTGLINPATGEPFVPGYDDADLTPDGSVKLSHARAAIARAEAH